MTNLFCNFYSQHTHTTSLRLNATNTAAGPDEWRTRNGSVSFSHSLSRSSSPLALTSLCHTVAVLRCTFAE